MSVYAGAVYGDVVAEVRTELPARADAAVAAGVDDRWPILDACLGFAELAGHDWELLARLRRPGGARAAGAAGRLPQAVPRLGAGRRRGPVHGAEARDAATPATTVLAARAGVWGVRAHDVAASADAVRVVSALGRAAAA